MSDIDRRSYKAAMRAWTLLEGQLMKSNDHRLNVADLFSAVGGAVGPDGNPVVHAGWSTAARDRGHNVQTYDWDQHGGKRSNILPDHRVNILNLNADDMIDHFGGPIDVLFASPPCEGWTLQQIGNTWRKPKMSNETKRMLNQLRGTGEEYPEELAAGWDPKNESGLMAQRTMQRTFDLIEDLREINPDMVAFVENPTSPLRYNPVSFGDWDMANVHHASYQEPASSELFGMGSEHFSPMLPERMHVGHGVPEKKPTDFFGYFPKDFVPRPRLSSSKDKTKDILYGSNVLYSDYPGSEDKRNLTRPELLQLLSQGGNVDFMERLSNAPELAGISPLPFQRQVLGQIPEGRIGVGKYTDPTGLYYRSSPRGEYSEKKGYGILPKSLPQDHPLRNHPNYRKTVDKKTGLERGYIGTMFPPESIRTSKFAGRYYAPAPGGATAGVNALPSITFTNREGQRVVADPYYTRSLIPYGQGLDAILATERQHGLRESPLGQTVLNPAQVIENFMRR